MYLTVFKFFALKFFFPSSVATGYHSLPLFWNADLVSCMQVKKKREKKKYDLQGCSEKLSA